MPSGDLMEDTLHEHELDDDELLHLVTERLQEDPAFHGRRQGGRLVVEVSDGEVTLRGVVRTAGDRRRVDILARALGASTVHNRLRVEEEQQADPRGARRRSA
jgi:osmotically-inducible protein OsmY